MKRPTRKRTPLLTETTVLARSARRCALCFHLNRDLQEKRGQIAHLDSDRTNADLGNLAWMCLDHHSQFDSITSQHKNYTVSEVTDARERLYELVSAGKHLDSVGATPNLQVDGKTFNSLLTTLPSRGSIRFIREQHFGAAFSWSELDDLRRLRDELDGPEHEFLDTNLEDRRKILVNECKNFLSTLATNTFRDSHDMQQIPRELEWENPKRYGELEHLPGRYTV